MKRKGYISLMVSLIAASLTAAATGTISWFINHITADLKNDITGSSNGAYFARGTGTSSDPFIINDARHLYNLAWLQYLGYFNRNILGASEGSTYFAIDPALTEPLDMSGWILPPIGTSLYPFVGNFNGNGKTISGLNTINSSTPADYIKYPSAVRTAGTVNNVNVLGAFGVYGTYNLNNGAVYPVDNQETDIPIYSETCSIRNVTFDNSHVTNYQTSTLAGIAVGYVNASVENTYVSSSSATAPTSLNLHGNTEAASATYLNSTKTTNLSNYTIAGYCEPNCVNQFTRNTSNVYSSTMVRQDTTGFTQQASGSSVGFGGSIDMNEMYDGLYAVWNQYNANLKEDGGNAVNSDTSLRDGVGVYSYPNNLTRTYREGVLVGDTSSEGSTYSPFYGVRYGTSNYVYSPYYTNYQSISVGNETYKSSQYTFAYRSNTARYMYLYGQDTISVSDKSSFPGNSQSTVTNNRYTTDNATDKFKISCIVNGVTYYLRRTAANTLGSTQDSDVATEWFYDDGNIFYVNSNGSIEYLSYNNSEAPLLTTAASPRSTYTYDSTNESYYTTSNGNNYYLTYNGSNWVFARNTTDTYYVIYNGSNYLCANGTSGTQNATSEASATHWQFNNNKKAYITNGSTNYYVSLASSNNGSVSLNTNANNSNGTFSGTLPSSNGATASGTYTYSSSDGCGGSTSYYLRYNNGWQTSTSSTNVTVKYVVKAGLSVYSKYTSSGSTTYEKKTTDTTNEYYSFTTNHTYFPLRQNKTNNIPNGTPLNSPTLGSNTGYVVGGGDIANNPQGSIRVSQYYSYDATQISDATYYCDPSLLGMTNSGGTVTLDTIYTIDGGGSHVINNIDSYNKLTKAKSSLESVISGDSQWIYGLHFVNTPVGYGPGVSARAEYAYVNGDEYYNYELPTNCIDFNLKEKGYINFIAGAYFGSIENGVVTANNCFFALDEIQRDVETQDIHKIRNIAAVYSDGVASHSVVYEYTDYNNSDSDTTNDRYSVAYKLSGGKKYVLDNDTNDANDVEYVPYSCVTELPSGYSMIFNCRWIDSSANLQTGIGHIRRNSHSGTTADSDGYVTGYPYYFEILVNDGEFCLGSPSFSGASGAYLMYLDIGANAQQTYRTTVTQFLQEIMETFELPKGMAIINAGTTSCTNKNSYAITIKNEYDGIVTVGRSVVSDVDTGVFSATSAADKVVLSYSDATIVMKKGNAEVSPVAISKTVSDIERIMFFDYLPNSNSFKESIVDKTVTTTYSYGVQQGNASTTYTVMQYSDYNSAESKGTQLNKGQIALFNNSGVTINTSVIDGENYKVSISEADYNALRNAKIDPSDASSYVTFNTTTYSSFAILYTTGGTFKIEYLPVTSIDDSATTYKLIDVNGGTVVKVTLTDNGGNVTDITNYIEVIKTEEGYVITYSGMVISILPSA